MRLPRTEYDWDEDYPKDMQLRSPDGNTIIDLWFTLEPGELDDFYKTIGSRLRTELPIRLTIGKSVEITVRKQGPGGATLTKKSSRIARFVGQALRVEYVETVRTASRAHAVVRDMLDLQLELTADPAVEAATSALVKALEPTLDRISGELHATLRDFLPDVKEVAVELSGERVLHALSERVRIIVDDGVATDLRSKGDGVQSLAALALVRKAAGSSPRAALFLGIEEPEAHLHPRAVHQLREVLLEIAGKQQVALTTHSPLLVDRSRLESNIIVRGNRATPARSIEDLRDALGVRVSDNLSSASLVLVVEGACDATLVSSLATDRSPILSKALASGSLAIESMGSASNLSARLDSLRSQLCAYHVLLDDDDGGRQAADKARTAGLLSASEESFTIVAGLRQAEIEDTLELTSYSASILEKFGVDLNVPEFRKGKRKWCDRVEQEFRRNGKRWDERTKLGVKVAVAEAIRASPTSALHHARGSSIAAVLTSLERRLTLK